MDLFDRDLLQRLGRTQATADQAQAEATQSLAEIDVLKLYVERLSMITEALWMILKENHGYSDEELLRRITEIDMKDGNLDGRVATNESPQCPQCKRQHVAKHRPRCLYCGTAIEARPFGG